MTTFRSYQGINYININKPETHYGKEHYGYYEIPFLIDFSINDPSVAPSVIIFKMMTFRNYYNTNMDIKIAGFFQNIYTTQFITYQLLKR